MTTRSRFALAAAWIVLSAVATAATPPADPKQDEKRAADLRLRADKGDGDAALQIGYLLALGRIPAPRYGTPITWFKKGCTARSLAACHNAGVSYESGKNGANQDYSEAAAYFLTQKYPHVMFRLLDEKDPSELIWKMIKPEHSKPFKLEI